SVFGSSSNGIAQVSLAQTLDSRNPVRVTLLLFVQNPDVPSEFSFLSLRPGDPPLTIQISNSDPSVGVPSAPSVDFVAPSDVPSSDPGFLFSPLAAGSTTLNFSAQRIRLSGIPATFRVYDPSVLTLPSGVTNIPVGFQTLVANGSANPLRPITVTSS